LLNLTVLCRAAPEGRRDIITESRERALLDHRVPAHQQRNGARLFDSMQRFSFDAAVSESGHAI
jgi:hypothetical protein